MGRKKLLNPRNKIIGIAVSVIEKDKITYLKNKTHPELTVSQYLRKKGLGEIK